MKCLGILKCYSCGTSVVLNLMCVFWNGILKSFCHTQTPWCKCPPEHHYHLIPCCSTVLPSAGSHGNQQCLPHTATVIIILANCILRSVLDCVTITRDVAVTSYLGYW